MRTARPSLATGLSAGLLLAAVGCMDLGPKPDPTNHYVLSPATGLGAVEPAATPAGGEAVAGPTTADPTVGIGPVRLPAYLDRSQIVRRRAPNRLDVSVHERWAEPLSTGFVRVLRQDLAACLPGRTILEHPWPARDRPALQVEVDVIRFEATREGSSALEARWTVRRLDPGATPVSRVAKLEEKVAGEGVEAEVAALSRLIGVLAADIAGELVGVPADA